MNLINNSRSVFYALGEYIIESFFGIDQKGNEVFPLIDSYFIKTFCEKYNLSDSEFLKHVKMKWKCISKFSSQMEIIGFVGFQLYAASKMENSQGYSSRNYRDRLCDSNMLNIDTNDWQRWAIENQDDFWKNYYSWCQKNGFIIANKCFPIIGKDRYVQYPKVHSEQILNREDLKIIAACFVENKLTPNEDVSEQEFWGIIGRNHYRWYYSDRSKKIILNNRELANKQIFHFYQVWDGEYIDNYSNKRVTQDVYQLHLFRTEDAWTLDISSVESGEIFKKIDIASVDLRKEINGIYNYRRKDIIVFKKDEYYENYWEETRYIEGSDEEGIAIFFTKSWPKLYADSDVITRYAEFVIVKINNTNYNKFFTQERGYKIKGGMKIAPNTYLLGAPPLLEFSQPMDFWVDGKIHKGNTINSFDFKEGKHHIKIKGYKSIDIIIAKPLPGYIDWGNYPKWILSRKKSICWNMHPIDGEVYGLDFEAYVCNTIENHLSEWCEKTLYNPVKKQCKKDRIVDRLTKI